MPTLLADRHLLAFIRPSTLYHPEQGPPLLAALGRAYPHGWDSVNSDEDFFRLGQVVEALLPLHQPVNQSLRVRLLDFDRVHGTGLSGWVEQLQAQYELAHPTFLHWARTAKFEPAY